MLTVSLKNYRRFLCDHDGEPHSATFAPGLTIVTGPNGAGKSTLVEAFEYCLFGPKRGRGRRPDERSDAASGDPHICCTFEVEGQVVTVERHGRAANLTLDGNKLALTGSAVEAELKRLLSGLTRDDFERIHVALQGDTAGLVEAPPSNREKSIEQILQFDVLREAVDDQKQARDASKEAVRIQGGRVIDELNLPINDRDLLQSCLQAQKTDSRMRHLNQFLQRARAGVTERASVAEEATKRRETADQAVEDKTGELTRVETAHVAARTVVQAFETQQEQFHAHELEIRACRERQEACLRDAKELANKREEAQGLADVARRYDALQQQIVAAQRRLEALATIKERYEGLSRAQERASSLGARLDELAEVDQLVEDATAYLERAEAAETALQVDPTAGDEQAWHSAAAMLDREVAEAQEAIAALERTGDQSECPTCERPLGYQERDRLIARFRAQLDEAFPKRGAELEDNRRSIYLRRATWQEENREAAQLLRRARRDYEAARDQQTTRKQMAERLEEAQEEHTRAEQAWAELDEPSYDPDEARRVISTRDVLTHEAKQLQPKVQIHSRLAEYQLDLAKKQTEATEWQQRAEEELAAQSALGYDSNTHQAAKNDEQAAGTAVAAAERVLGDAKADRESRISEENTATEAAARAASELDRLEADAAQLELDSKLFDLLDEFKDHFFAANTRLVAERTTQLLLQVISDGSITKIEFQAGGELVYFDASHALRPVERLSGGEKALLGLCLRIALAERALRIAPGGRLDFLFLDEVLSALDDERREGVQRVLDEVLRGKLFRHIVMITHLDAVKDGWRGATLEVRKREGKRSELATMVAANGFHEIDLELGEDSLP